MASSGCAPCRAFSALAAPFFVVCLVAGPEARLHVYDLLKDKAETSVLRGLLRV